MADLTNFIKRDKNLDTLCSETTDTNHNMLVPWYIMASYAYYVEDDPIISDRLFDKMAKTMLDEWETIDHFHKEYLTVDALKAGTYLGEYPSRVKVALGQVRNIYK